MCLRPITVILFILPLFSMITISQVDAKRSIRFELDAKFIKTEYVNGEPEPHPSIYNTTWVLGDYGKEGSFEAWTGRYLVDKEWLDVQFNIQNKLLDSATLHLTIPKLTDAEYHFIQDDKDPGSFYYLDYQLELLNNIEIPLLSEVGDNPLKFELTGEDVCNNIHFFAFKRGNETHHDEIEIYSCVDPLAVLVIILELEDGFWDGKPRLEVPDLIGFDFEEKRQQINIKNIGSGDLWIYDFTIDNTVPPLFRLEGIVNCTSDKIEPDAACAIELVKIRDPIGEEWAWLRIDSNSITSPDSVRLYAGPKFTTPVPSILHPLLLMLRASEDEN